MFLYAVELMFPFRIETYAISQHLMCKTKRRRKIAYELLIYFFKSFLDYKGLGSLLA